MLLGCILGCKQLCYDGYVTSVVAAGVTLVLPTDDRSLAEVALEEEVENWFVQNRKLPPSWMCSRIAFRARYECLLVV